MQRSSSRATARSWSPLAFSLGTLAVASGCGAPAETPTPDPSETPVITATPSQTVTPELTPTATPVTQTATPETVTATPETPTPSPTPSPTPTATPVPPGGVSVLTEGLESSYLHEYIGLDAGGSGDGGIGHTTYFKMATSSADYLALPAQEQAKVVKIQKSKLASGLFIPTLQVPGTEATGTLVSLFEGQPVRHEVLLKLPTAWNGSLVVLPSPGVHPEFGSEGILSYWLVEQGYAVAASNKGMTNGGTDGSAYLLSGKHPTEAWGTLLLDLTAWAIDRLEDATARDVDYTYAAGLSNGGYVVRRMLELDHQRVEAGLPRLIDAGLSWSGAWWPDQKVMDTDANGQLSPAELAAASNLINDCDQAALTMKWAYDAETLCTPAHYTETPPFTSAHDAMADAGFLADSAVMWSSYNTTFDYLKAYPGYEFYKGVGYFNVSAYLYRAELRGETNVSSAAYSCYTLDGNEPPYYTWLETQADRGWRAEDVPHLLAVANSAVFSAPLITIHGTADALLGAGTHAQGYAQAVQTYGDPSLHRLFLVAHAPHVDLHADGGLDFDFDGTFAEEGAADQLTPLQPYVMRAFDYLAAWVEEGTEPPADKTLETNPAQDQTDPSQITFE